MKLPNGDQAVVELSKLTDYCLNLHHPRGRNKARVFATVGIRVNDATFLRDALLDAAKAADCSTGEKDVFGRRYTVDFELALGGRKVVIRSTWIVRSGEELPRLTSCYVL